MADELASLVVETSAPNVGRTDAELRKLEGTIGRVEQRIERLRATQARQAAEMARTVRSYQQAAQAISMVEAANRATAASGGAVVTSFGRQRAAAASLATQLRQLESRQDAYRSAVVKTNAQMAGFGTAANANTRALGNQGAAARRAANDNDALGVSLGLVHGALIAIGLGGLTRELIQTADTAKLLEGRLRQVVASEEELVAVQERLFQIAQRTRSSYESTVTLFQRVARSADQLGKSQEELLGFTELIQKAIISSGTTSQEAASGVIQLSQALASGKLAGDEFRTVLETMPAVARAVGDGLNKMGLSTKTGVAALYELRDAGKLTATNFIEAFMLMRESVERDFSKVPLTVGQAMTVLGNELIRAIANFDKTTGVTATLSGAIVGLAGNLDTLGKAVSGIAAGAGFLALIKAGSVLGQVLLALGAALATVTGAVIAVGVALVAGITYLVAFRDEIKLSADGLLTLGDYADVAFAKIREAIEALEPILGDLFSPEKAQRDLAAAVEFILRAFATARGAAIAFVDAVINAFRSVSPVVAAAGSAISAALTAAFGEGLKLAVAFRQDLAEVMDGDVVFDKLAAAADGAFGRINEAATAEFAGLADKLTDIWNSSPTTEALGQVPNPIAGMLEEWREQARLIRETKDLLAVWGVEINKAGVSTTAAAKATASLTKEQKNALRSAAESIDDMRREAEAAERIAEATSKGALAVADETLAHKKAEAVHKIRQALQHAGLKITQDQIKEIEKYIDATERANRTTAGRQIVNDLDLEIQKQKDLAEAYGQGEDAVRKVNEAYEIRERLTRANVAADSDLGREIADTVTKLGEQSKATNLVKDSVNELANFFESAFDRIGAAITQAFATGEVSALNFGDLAKAVFSEVIQFALKLSVINPLKNAVAGTNLPTIDVFGLLGSAGGAAASGGAAAGGGTGFFAPITNAISSGFSSATSGVASFLFGTAPGGAAAAGVAPMIGGATNAGAAGLFGTYGAGAATFSAVAPWIAAAAAIAIPLLSGMFGGSPSVGETSVGRITDLTDPDSTVFSFDNGGSDTSTLEGVIKAVADAIESGTERFIGTLRPGSGFDFGYFPSPESGNSQAAGINLKPIIANVLEDTDRFKGLSEQEAIDKATLIALQEMVDYQSATLDEIAANSDATTAAELIADLDFGRNFDMLNTALGALGGTVNANTLAQARQTVAIQEQARTFAEQNAGPIVDALETALRLFPASTTRDRATSTTVRGVEVPIRDEGSQVGLDFFEEGTAEFDRLVAAGAEVVTQIRSVTDSITEQSASYAENMERVRQSAAIAGGSIDILVDQITGAYEPALRGVVQAEYEQGRANLDALAVHLADVNAQITEANEQFPGLNLALHDTAAILADAQTALLVNARDARLENRLSAINEATGLGAINTILGLIDARDVNAAEDAALGVTDDLTARTLDAQIRNALESASLSDVGAILSSEQIFDDAARATIAAVLQEKALTAARTIETDAAAAQVETLQALAEEHENFADAANDNARALRQAAAGFAVSEEFSTLSPLGRLEEARRQFESAYSVANDNDPTDQASQQAIDRLPTLSEQLLTASKAYYSTNSQYVADYTRVQEALANTATRQEDIERQQLTALQAIETRIVELGGTLGNANGARYVQGSDGQYISTGAGGLPAGLDLGRDAERNIQVYQAYQLAGVTYRGAGEGQVGQDRAANATLNAILNNLNFAEGGMVAGGIPGRDSVAAMLMPGERVLTVDQNAIFERMAATLNAWAPIVSELRALRQDFADAANDTEELNDKVERLITVTYSTGTATAEGVRQGNDQRGRMLGTAEREAGRPAGRKVTG